MVHRNSTLTALSVSLILVLLLEAACGLTPAPAQPVATVSGQDIAQPTVAPELVAVEQTYGPAQGETSQPAEAQPTVAGPRRCAPDKANWSKVSGGEVEPGVKIEVSKLHGLDFPGSKVAFQAEDVDYTDPAGWTFRLTVYAENGAAVSKFVEALALCFEAQQMAEPYEVTLLSQLDEVDPPAILVRAIADALGKEEGQLYSDVLPKCRAATAAGEVSGLTAEVPSLVSLLMCAGVDPNQVLGNALTQFSKAWDAKWGAQDADWANNAVKQSYEAAFDPEGRDRLSALEPPVPLAQDGGLAEDPDVVTVSFEWQNPPKENPETWFISFGLDPSLPPYKWHSYEWKWQRAVWTQIDVGLGTVGLYLERSNSSLVCLDSCWTTDGNRSRKLSAGRWWSSKRWYRAEVYGWDASNRYTMYGTWQYAAYTQSP